MKRITLIFLLLGSLALYAQGEDKPAKNQVMLSGALDSNSAWELGLFYTRRLASWFGIGCGVNGFEQYSNEIHVSGPVIQGTHISEWILSDNSARVGGLQLNTFVHVNTPPLFCIDDAKVNLYMEPGVLMTVSSNKCEATYWDGHGYYITRVFSGEGGVCVSWICRIGLALENEFGTVNIGCFTSNCDIYANKRNISIGNVSFDENLPKRHSNWGVYVGVGLKFH